MINKDQASHSGLWASILFVLPFVWAVFIEPRLVFSEHLEPLEKALIALTQQNAKNSESYNEVQVALIEMRIEMYQERMQSLENRKHARPLTSSEYLRLNQYTDRVEVLKRRLERIK